MLASEELSRVFFTAPRPSGKSPLVPPPANENYFYATSRLLSYWPEINGNNKTFFEANCQHIVDNPNTEESAVGKLANVWHKKTRAIGVIQNQMGIPGVGIDICTRLDRRYTRALEITPEDFMDGNEYSCVSQESWCDRSKSQFIVMLDELNAKDLAKQRVLSAEESSALGITAPYLSDPTGYRYEGKYRVVEACNPMYILGVAFLDDPADATAKVFELAASREIRDVEQSFYGMDSPALGDVSDPFGDIRPQYHDVEYSELDDGERNALPDHAYAAVYRDNDGHAQLRKLPLYKSPEAVKSNKPDPGLVKAAMEALTTGFRGERAHLPDHVHAEARTRVRAAHDKLFPRGDEQSSMDPKDVVALTDPLNAEIASLRVTIASVETAKAEESRKAESLQTQIEDLKQAVVSKDAEISSLKGEIESRNADAKAVTRFDELSKIDGYTVADEEKSALMTALAGESDADFTIRKQGVEIAVLRKSAEEAARNRTNPSPSAEEAALRSAEEAAALANGDVAKFQFKPGAAKQDVFAIL